MNGRGQGRRGQGGGRGQGKAGQQPGRMGGRTAAGPPANCVCPKCGHKQIHERGVPCIELKCPTCGSAMTRE